MYGRVCDCETILKTSEANRLKQAQHQCSALIYTILSSFFLNMFSEKSDKVRISTVCPSGWTGYSGRCFLYVQTPLTWADAEVIRLIWFLSRKFLYYVDSAGIDLHTVNWHILLTGSFSIT